MKPRPVFIGDLMVQSGVKFGTSGARGLVKHMTDEICYAYTVAFIQYLEEIGELSAPSHIALGGDLRASTDRIMKSVARAIQDRGYHPVNCGRLPSPALAYYGLIKGIPSVMVTGSHIPEDRNGIKYTTKHGEILKHDETGIKRQQVEIDEDLFSQSGRLLMDPVSLPVIEEAVELYSKRYINSFPENCLRGKRIGVYQHSAVGRDIMTAILRDLGAEVTTLGRSDTFIPVDTEAIREEDIEVAREWSNSHSLDSIVSSDGDSDRPLISDEAGTWLRGDVAGILCASYFKADAIATPVSCNTAVEKCGLFHRVYRTRIGSPFVIEAMQRAGKEGSERVVGYEANGGFLLGSDIQIGERTLRALPTRDAVIVHLAVLLLSVERNKSISELVAKLPKRFTYSNRLKQFPTEKSKDKLLELWPGDSMQDMRAIEAIFRQHFGPALSVDITDGLRITFENDEVVHLRPSGNAPEFRCYNEADTESRAKEMSDICMSIMERWKSD